MSGWDNSGWNQPPVVTDPNGYGTAPAMDPQPPKRAFVFRHPIMLVIVVLGMIGTIFVVGVIGVLLASFANSDAVKLAVIEAKKSPAVIEKIGTPVERGWLVSGSMHTEGSKGSAQLSVPLSGPKGSGSLQLDAVKELGAWKLKSLQFRKDGDAEVVEIVRAPKSEGGAGVVY